MVTIKDIARVVGVSATTVSNVIHGNLHRVSQKTVERVHAAIADMRYVPNLSARSLVCSASRIIGAIDHPAPPGGGFFQDPFRGALLAGIEQALRKGDYYLMVRTVGSVRELHSLLNNWRLDGLILAGAFPSDFYRSLLAQRTPFLLVDGYEDNLSAPQVRQEDRRGGFLATGHLLDRGHRNILFCGPPATQRGMIFERCAGYHQALRERRLTPRREIAHADGIGAGQGIALGQKLAGQEGYTAIFAADDLLAAALIAGLRSAGRRVPEDVSVVGFGDLDIARLTSPPLTTVRQDAVHKGVVAAETLLASLEQGRERQRPEEPMPALPVELVERQSVRAVGPAV